MDRYDLIVEELQNRLDNDEIDLEFAEAVNELAYNKYVLEKTRLDKEMDKRADEIEKLNNKRNILIDKGVNLKDDKKDKKLEEKIDDMMNKSAKINAVKGERTLTANYDRTIACPATKYRFFKDDAKKRIMSGNSDARMAANRVRSVKHQFDSEGMSPEERYKANRYLDTQKEFKKLK